MRYFLSRSLLTLLGIVIGSSVVICIINIGFIGKKSILEEFENLGAYSSYIQYSSNINPIDVVQLKEIKAELQKLEIIKQVSIVNQYTSPTEFKSIHLDDQSIHGVDNDFFSFGLVKLIDGRILFDLDEKENYGLVSRNFITKLIRQGEFLSTSDQLLIEKEVLKVVGILDTTKNTSFSLVDVQDSILIPLESAMTMGLSTFSGLIIISRPKKVDFIAFENQISKTLENFPAISFEIVSPESLIKTSQRQNKSITLMLIVISSISLVVGGVGIMNIMILSVSERKKEIGLNLAIGAKPIDIKIQFLIESTLLCFIGGLISVLVSLVVIYWYTITINVEFNFSVISIVIGLLSSSVVGLFFGYYPAAKASKLSPVEALNSL